jgi:hypothetical protein
MVQSTAVVAAATFLVGSALFPHKKGSQAAVDVGNAGTGYPLGAGTSTIWFLS